MDYKEQMLEWIDKYTIELGISDYPYVSVPDLKEAIARIIPSEKEIAKGIIRDAFRSLSEYGGDNKPLFLDEIIDWLDKEAE